MKFPPDGPLILTGSPPLLYRFSRKCESLDTSQDYGPLWPATGLRKICGCSLLGYKSPVLTLQETHYFSAT
jgi:hypothetical protein